MRDAVQTSKRDLALYVASWRCPAGLPLEECKLPQNQNAARTIHRDEVQAFHTTRTEREGEIARRIQNLPNRRASLEARIAAFSRLSDDLERNARNAFSEAEAQSQRRESRAKELEDKQAEAARRSRCCPNVPRQTAECPR